MKALIYSAPECFSVMDVPTPAPRRGQVLIRVGACGVCKTDLHIHHGKFSSAFPLIPGHEFAGQVAAIGEGVTRCCVGDRVVADNQRACGVCDNCRRGEPLFCAAMFAQGVNAHGGFAEYTIVEDERIYPLAAQRTFAEGTLVEPAACVIHGLDIIKPRVGDDVLLFGAGPTGLLMAQLLRRAGVSLLAVAEVAPRKRELAEKLAQALPVAVSLDHPHAHVEQLRALRPQGFDIVIDATGVPAVVERLPDFVRIGGKLVFYGVCPEEAEIRIQPYDIFRRELSIFGSFSQLHTFSRAVALFNQGLINTEGMLTHSLPLEGWGEALRLMQAGGEAVKIVITP